MRSRPLLALASPLTAAALAVTGRAALETEGETVALERFEVSTTLASYATPTASVATKTEVPLRATPFSVQVLNAAFLEDLRTENLADLYPYITGLSYNSRIADGFTLRGFAADLSTVQVNGLPGNVTVFGSPSSANVERVEVLKGPASILYGQIEPGGIVNLVTKRPQARARHELFTTLSTYAGRTSDFGDDPGATVTFDSTGPLTTDGRWLYRVIASYESLASFRDDVSSENIYLVPSLTWRPQPATTLNLEVELARERGRSDDGLVAPGNDVGRIASIDTRYQAPEDSDDDDGATIALTLEHAFTPAWRTRAAWRSVWHEDNRTLFESNALVTVSGELRLRRRFRDQLNRRQYHFLDWNVAGDVGPERLRHHLLFGVNGGYELRRFSRLSLGPTVGTVSIYDPYTPLTTPAAVPGSDRETWLANYGAYVSDQIDIGEHWHALVGLRYDGQSVDFTDFQPEPNASDHQRTDAVVPSVGLVRDLGRAWSVYASYAESFMPASVENEDINGNNGFPPREGVQYETGIKVEDPTGRFTATASIYEITLKNVIESLGVTNANGNAAYALLGETRSRGAEFDWQVQPLPHWQLRGGYSYIDAEVTESRTSSQVGATPQNVSRHQAHLWTRYNLPSGALRGLGFGLGVSGQSEREAVTTTIAANRVTLPSYVRVDAGLYYAWSRYSLALNVKNALDELYYLGGTSNTRIVPAEPRELTLSVRAVF